MRCPRCNGKIETIQCVHTDENETYRRKQCQSCGHNFFTVEYEIENNAQFQKEWEQYVLKYKPENRE